MQKGIGERLRALRHEAGWTQAELSVRSSVGEKQIGAIENGDRNPSLKTLIALANALSCTLDALVRGIDMVHPGPPTSFEKVLILRHLDRLTNDDLLEVLALTRAKVDRITRG